VRGLVIVLTLLAATPVAAAIDVDRIEHARGAVMTDDYQASLPGEGTELPEAHEARVRREETIDTRYERGPETGPLSSIFTLLLYGVVIVGCALGIFWLATELAKYGGDDVAIAGDDDAASSAVDLAVIEKPLGDAEELSNRGEYREAIHTLLLRTLQELVRSAAVQVKPAMTSREILARVPLLADAREALAGLITAVELTHFGNDEATLEDYQRCRAEFQRFATAFRASGMRGAPARRAEDAA
jgi:hypothetical protein